MPLTPFHIGPPVLLLSVIYLKEGHKIVKPKYLIWLIGCSIGALIPDLQGFYSIFFNRDVSLHGFSHTLLGAFLYSGLGLVLLWSIFMVAFRYRIDLVQGYFAIFLGILLFHLLPDMLIWSDMNIFWPFFNYSPGIESRYGLVTIILIFQFVLGFVLGFIGLILHPIRLELMDA